MDPKLVAKPKEAGVGKPGAAGGTERTAGQTLGQDERTAWVSIAGTVGNHRGKACLI